MAERDSPDVDLPRLIERLRIKKGHERQPQGWWDGKLMGFLQQERKGRAAAGTDAADAATAPAPAAPRPAWEAGVRQWEHVRKEPVRRRAAVARRIQAREPEAWARIEAEAVEVLALMAELEEREARLRAAQKPAEGPTPPALPAGPEKPLAAEKSRVAGRSGRGALTPEQLAKLRSGSVAPTERLAGRSRLG
jgi:hypothetical protein